MENELENHQKFLKKMPKTLPESWSSPEFDQLWTYLDIAKSERQKLNLKIQSGEDFFQYKGSKMNELSVDDNTQKKLSQWRIILKRIQKNRKDRQPSSIPQGSNTSKDTVESSGSNNKKMIAFRIQNPNQNLSKEDIKCEPIDFNNIFSQKQLMKDSFGLNLLFSETPQPSLGPLDPLVLCYPSSKHQETILPPGCVLGRGSYNISSREKQISREHCRILSRPTGYFINDMSRYGTFLFIEPSVGLYLKSKMEIIIDECALLVYVKRNILELVSNNTFGIHRKFVVDKKSNLYLSIQENDIIEKKKETKTSLVCLTREESGEIVMKPLEPEILCLRLKKDKEYPLVQGSRIRLGNFPILVLNSPCNLSHRGDDQCLICGNEKSQVTLFPCRHSCVGVRCFLNKTVGTSCPRCFAFIHRMDYEGMEI